MGRKKVKTIVRFSFWAAGVGLVFMIGMYYFPREYPDLSFLEAFYFTLRLFILEHDLPRFPRSRPLIFIYFFAPLIALSALGTALTYLFRFSPILRTRWLSDHVIICGVGRTGKLLAETFKQRGVRVVGVDAGQPESFDEWRSDTTIPVIFGDFLSRPVLEQAGAKRARAVVFASGDDLLNLEGAIRSYGWLRSEAGPVRLLWTHIATEKLADTARQVLRTDGQVVIRFFDTYHIAARKMIEKFFHRSVRPGVREITIMGFGKFGRDLFELLGRMCEPEGWHSIRVLDIMDLEKEVHLLAGELGIADRVRFQQGDVEDITLSDDPEKAFFLCTDDDIGNLAAALSLTRNTQGTHIYVRMAQWPISAIEEHLRDRSGITFVNINDLIVEGVADLPGIFQTATMTDLTRTARRA